jgi:hypothetical protein
MTWAYLYFMKDEGGIALISPPERPSSNRSSLHGENVAEALQRMASRTPAPSATAQSWFVAVDDSEQSWSPLCAWRARRLRQTVITIFPRARPSLR